MKKLEQLQTAVELVPEATDDDELAVAMGWVRDESRRIDFHKNQELFFLVLEKLSKTAKSVDFFYYESNQIFSKLLIQKRFFSLIEEVFKNPNHEKAELIIETLYCVGYLFEFNSVQAKKIYQLLGENHDLTVQYLHKPETAAYILQILFSLKKHAPECWKSDVTIDTVIREFLFSGNSSPAELIAAFHPIDLAAWENNARFQYYMLDLIGFSREEAEEIVETWDSVYDQVDTLRKSILPNMLTLLFLEGEAAGVAKIMYEFYGIMSFARYDIEQFIRQHEVYQQLIETEAESEKQKPSYVLHIGIDNDNSGALLGKREKLWNHASRLLKSQDKELIVTETGKSVENIIEMIKKITELHGQADQIIVSVHACAEGFILCYQYPVLEWNMESEALVTAQPGQFIYLSQEEIQHSLVPALQASLKPSGTVIFNICEPYAFIQSLQELTTFLPSGDRNVLITVSESPDAPLIPIYHEWTKAEYEDEHLQNS